MSTTYPIITINYEKRKPSRAVIMRTLAEYLKQGGKAFEFNWGENSMDVYFDPRDERWHGYGWIKDIGGDDIAQELNQIRKQAQAGFLKDRFIFVHVK
jgi:hypothetical protein